MRLAILLLFTVFLHSTLSGKKQIHVLKRLIEFEKISARERFSFSNRKPLPRPIRTSSGTPKVGLKDLFHLQNLIKDLSSGKYNTKEEQMNLVKDLKDRGYINEAKAQQLRNQADGL